MARLWTRIIRNTKLIQDMTVDCDMSGDDIFMNVEGPLQECCSAMDIEYPIWLDINKRQFIMHHKARFNSDNFIQEIDYDCLEIQVIDED